MSWLIFHEYVELAVADAPGTARKLLVDVNAIRSGTAPTTGDLVNAPLLDRWRPVLVDAGARLVLAGEVDGHPYRSDGLMVTSTLCAIETKTFRWARTQGRWYRLGSHFGAFRIRGRTAR